MLSVKKRSWEFDFVANSNAYTGYTAIINSTAVSRYWGISGIKMGNRQGETRWIESPMFHSCLAPTSLPLCLFLRYFSLPYLSPMSLSPIFLSSIPLPYVSFSDISIFHVSRLSRSFNSPLALFSICLF